MTKNTILSQLARVYDPLGIISPTLVEGKRIFRDACEQKGWDTEVSKPLVRDYFRWLRQLRQVKIPRSLVKDNRKVKSVKLHIISDASDKACLSAIIAVVEQGTEKVKSLLTSKSRISKRNTSTPRLELVGGQMAANMAKNVCKALEKMPINSVICWMDSMVPLFWISNPGKPWKAFVANRVKKVVQIQREINTQWKFCPSSENVSDLGSRGASIDKMLNGKWSEGPDWLLNEEEWPEQPELKSSPKILEEQRPIKEAILCNLKNSSMVFEIHEELPKKIGTEENVIKGPLTTEEIMRARELWVKRAQRNIMEMKETPGWRLVRDECSGILRCQGRIQGYCPIYLEESLFAEKLIRYTHEKVMHMGVANTMGAQREIWWIPKMRSLVKKVIRNCNVCKVFSAKLFGNQETALLPLFRTTMSLPFQRTGVDFAGPLRCRGNHKTDEVKVYVIIFTCAVMRGVHLEVTQSQTAEEFQQKLNAFITRKTRPEMIVSDNASVFKTTAKWIKLIRKSEKLQDYLAAEGITWRFNLSKSPWWGGMYERLIKDIKKTLYKTLGKTLLKPEQLEAVIMDIERHLNNRPLTYVESDSGEEQVLTPNIIMWGKDSHILEELEVKEDNVSKMYKRMKNARQHVWSRWSKEYVNSLMEYHCMNKKNCMRLPEIGEIALVVGEEKNRGHWMKGKVEKLIKGKDNVVRGVILRHKGHLIERPLQAVCPLEICSDVDVIRELPAENVAADKAEDTGRVKRRAAADAEVITRLCFEDD